MERKEVIRELKHLLSLSELAPRTENNSLLNVNLNKRIIALSSAIAEAELMERVSGGVEKRITLHNASEGIKNCNAGFNLAIDLCNAHWVGKMGGMEKFLIQWERDNCHDMLPAQLAAALTNYLTKGL